MTPATIAYKSCEYAWILFSIMWKLDLIQSHPFLSTISYVDFYERLKEGTYGKLSSI